MPQTGKSQQPARINGQIIIDQLTRNMELGQFEMGYSVLVPCIVSVYLHPTDYALLAGIQDLIKEDARRALAAQFAQWNACPPLFKRGKKTKLFRIAAMSGGSNSSPTAKTWSPPATSKSTPS